MKASKFSDGQIKDTTLSKMGWTRAYKESCENVGKHFTSASHTSADMEAKQPYRVQKNNQANQTTYTKKVIQQVCTETAHARTKCRHALSRRVSPSKRNPNSTSFSTW